MHGFSTIPGQVLGHARCLVARSLMVGRRLMTLGALLLLAGSTVTVLATANTPPDITSATVTPSLLNEGRTVSLQGSFADPDVGDLHTVRIHWNDGSSTQVLQLAAGQTTFQASHIYADQQLIGFHHVSVTVYDRQAPPGSNDNSDGAGQDSVSIPIDVRNVAPRFVDSSIVGTATASGVVVEGDFTDPGAADAHQITGAMGNPIFPPSQISMSCAISGKGERHFRCQYTQQPNAAPRTYDVHLKVRDDDGGQDTHDINVRFNGIARP